MGSTPGLDRRTALIGALALLGVGAIVFGPAIAHEGFYADDWENAAAAIYHYEPYHIIYHEPILGLLLPLPNLVFGARPAWQLALALLLGVGASLTFAALLLRLRLSRFDALVISALALLCPFADALRLWSTAGLDSVALMLCFGGLIGGIDRVRGGEGLLARRYRWLLGASFLTYVAVVPACLLTGPVYRLAGVGWPRAKAAWRADLWRIGPLAVLVSAVNPKQHQGPGAIVTHAVRIARDGVGLLGRALVPVDGVPYWIVAIAVAAVAAVTALLAARRLKRSRGAAPRAALAIRWLRIAGIALIAVVICWAPYAFGPSFYHPLAPGILNRVNIVAAFGVAVVAYALAAVAVSPLRGVSPALLVAPVAAGWVVWISRDIHRYDIAARAQAAVLAQVRALPRGRPPLSVFVGGYALTISPQIPVFIGSWDLDGAVKLTVGEGDAVGEPLRTVTALVCGRAAAVPDDIHVNRLEPRPYENLILLNVATHHWLRVADQRQCLAAAPRLGFRAAPGIPVARDNLGRPTKHVDL